MEHTISRVALDEPAVFTFNFINANTGEIFTMTHIATSAIEGTYEERPNESDYKLQLLHQWVNLNDDITLLNIPQYDAEGNLMMDHGFENIGFYSLDPFWNHIPNAIGAEFISTEFADNPSKWALYLPVAKSYMTNINSNNNYRITKATMLFSMYMPFSTQTLNITYKPITIPNICSYNFLGDAYSHLSYTPPFHNAAIQFFNSIETAYNWLLAAPTQQYLFIILPETGSDVAIGMNTLAMPKPENSSGFLGWKNSFLSPITYDSPYFTAASAVALFSGTYDDACALIQSQIENSVFPFSFDLTPIWEEGSEPPENEDESTSTSGNTIHVNIEWNDLE